MAEQTPKPPDLSWYGNYSFPFPSYFGGQPAFPPSNIPWNPFLHSPMPQQYMGFPFPYYPLAYPPFQGSSGQYAPERLSNHPAQHFATQKPDAETLKVPKSDIILVWLFSL